MSDPEETLRLEERDRDKHLTFHDNGLIVKANDSWFTNHEYEGVEIESIDGAEEVDEDEIDKVFISNITSRFDRIEYRLFESIRLIDDSGDVVVEVSIKRISNSRQESTV